MIDARCSLKRHLANCTKIVLRNTESLNLFYIQTVSTPEMIISGVGWVPLMERTHTGLGFFRFF